MTSQDKLKEELIAIFGEMQDRYPRGCAFLQFAVENINWANFRTPEEIFFDTLQNSRHTTEAAIQRALDSPLCPINRTIFNKVEAIKWLREESGCGLKEAKDAVEARYYPNTWIPRSTF